MEELLDDYDKEEINLIAASKGKRFTNYLIDAIAFYIFAIVVAGLFFIDEENVEYLESDTDFTLNIISMLFFAGYYFVIESLAKGKTLGKYITKTRTVDYHGNIPTPNQFLKRSFSRIVPFDALSFLGSKEDGWHDRWSDTMVIDEQKSSY